MAVRVLERQQEAMEEHAMKVEYIPKISVLFYIPVAFVVDDRKIEVGKMLADLMAATRYKLGLHE